MRRFLVAAAVVALAACGGGDGDGDSTILPGADAGIAGDAGPTLALRVEGTPAFLTGEVKVVIEAAPAGAVSAVELAVGDQRLGNATAEPFSVTFDSTILPDGPVKLVATGVLAGGEGTIQASLDAEVANLAPTLTVVSPAAGATIVGSPSKGFVIQAQIEAGDGNGIQNATVSFDDQTIDLGDGSQPAEITLTGIVDFPRPPVTLTFRATDESGAETEQTIEVTLSNVGLRYDADQGFMRGAVEQIAVAEDGRAVVRDTAGHIYGFAAASPEATPSLAVITQSVNSPFAFSSGSVFFQGNGDNGQMLMRATIEGETSTLAELSSQQGQNPSFSPIALASGRVLWGWQSYMDGSAHLLGFGADGAQAFDTDVAGMGLSSAIIERPDGKVLALARETSTGASFIEVFDSATGAALERWNAPEGVMGLNFLMAVDAQGAIVNGQGLPQNGPPPTIVVAFDPSGAVQWSQPVDRSASAWFVDRLAGGDALMLLTSSSTDMPSSLSRFSASGVTPVWTAPAGVMLTLLARLGDSFLLSESNMSTGATTLLTVSADGTEGWSLDLEGRSIGQMKALSDGGFSMMMMPNGPETSVAWKTLNADGTVRWSQDVADVGMDIKGMLELADDAQLVVAYYNADASKLTYEGRDRASGTLLWRYVAPQSGFASGGWQMVFDAPWGLVLGPVPLETQTNEYGEESNATALMGFVP